jgi:hypothetical protein
MWWHSCDYNSPNLSKNSLGEFFSLVLSYDVLVGEIWVFNRNYHRSAVYVSIFMSKETKEAIEVNSKFRFVSPPKLTLNCSKEFDGSKDTI